MNAPPASIRSLIEDKLAQGMAPLHLEVLNESDRHNVPPGSESHFKVVVVSPEFEGKTLIARHRMVYRLLGDELQGGVHALALHTYTEQDWRAKHGRAPMSPPCRGGGARPSD